MSIWKFGRKKEPTADVSTVTADPVSQLGAAIAAEPQPISGQDPTEKTSWFQRLKTGLRKTQQAWRQQIGSLFVRRTIDEALFQELEDRLIQADLGWPLAQKLIDKLRQEVKKQHWTESTELEKILKSSLLDLCLPAKPAENKTDAKPRVVLIVGVNGVGKTTTIGKLAGRWTEAGQKVLLAAGDTFRAAAIEQLKIWAERTGSPMIAQQTGSDPAAVIFDAFQSAVSRGSDILLADTAGRLHNKAHLMQELEKIKRVLGKLDPHAPHEVWLVLDATIGQNAIQQMEVFHQSLGLTGLIVTKLDGTAKAGVLFQLIDRWRLPVHFIGVGEGIVDLQPFEPVEFVDTLFE